MRGRTPATYIQAILNNDILHNLLAAVSVHSAVANDNFTNKLVAATGHNVTADNEVGKVARIATTSFDALPELGAA